ncbi:RCC1/BLIP-II [Macrolepiota fuliginosa MF-IS2]|uniref:RCC1/BLIP-II n=1 Tax=Macrolepiota fuliginosa MF-IS2 TaxID=1400762 RepID=A0A9P5XNN7_9AGAR|nr:RCC1/BLIP-II [Macrolepiota fuliginosa MF-IS2]
MPSAKLTLSDLPLEVLLDNLFPILPTADLLRLATTSKGFSSLGSDESLWRRKLRDDFNFDGAGTARRAGWKFIYRGLSKPRVFVWGERSHGRLGLNRFPKHAKDGVPFPMQLSTPGASIIKLIAGGMSFHALDTQGNVHVWGALHGLSYALVNDGYSRKEKVAKTPLKLRLPNPVRSISCGRLHSSALDNKNKIWTFVNWGRPFELASPLLSQPDSEPIQIECGWSFSSALLKNGEVLVWWPTTGSLAEIIRAEGDRLDNQSIGQAQAVDGVIPCHTWTVTLDPVLLPSLPPLPDITNAEEEFKKNPPRLIEVGGMEDQLVGLTNYGHVLKYNGLHNEQATTSDWHYLPEFSELSRVRQLPEFSDGEGVDKIAPPESLKITHVSAHFRHFFAYSTGASSVVLQGESTTASSSKPKVISELQNKDVISVVLGDYHNAALTANGKLYTWGQFSNGALGLGDPLMLPLGAPGGFNDENQLLRARDRGHGTPPDVAVPTEVKFDHGRKAAKDRFCFDVTAAGWHTGALVIDLEDENEEEEGIEWESEEELRSGFSHDHWQSPPIIPLRGTAPAFRIGFAGRGRGRGHYGRGGPPSA